MGRTRKRHNWKARQIVETVIDDSDCKKIKLDIPSLDPNKYDDSNALVLPSAKRQKILTKNGTKKQAPQIKKLSNKKRKSLEKVLASKKKKLNRADLFEKLATVQASPADIRKYLSTACVQTKGLKRISEVSIEKNYVNELGGIRALKIRNIRGCNKVETVDEVQVNDDEESIVKVDEIDDVHVKNESCNEICKTMEVQNEDSIKEFVQEPAIEMSKKSIQEILEQDCLPSVYVPVNRSPGIQESRLKLPILAEEQTIMEAVRENPIVVLCGETGSGKTTQVPQFLFEAGYASDGRIIGVTEPRRVAAVTMSRRVADEMGLSSDKVSYQIRFEGNTTDETLIKFMTDGVLLKEMQTDFLLSKYSVIIVDEAHERSVYTDILIGLLSRVVPLRNKRNLPLRLIVMSATLRIEDFTENRRLFRTPPPVIKIDSRQFPVSVHFNKRTPIDDYMSETYRKICKIHRQLPVGGILVFVTGQQEVNVLCHKLKREFPFSKGTSVSHQKSNNNVKNVNDIKPEVVRSSNDVPDATVLPKIKLDDYAVLPLDDDDEMKEKDDASEIGDLLSDDDDLVESKEFATERLGKETPMYVLPFYSLLAPYRQEKVFRSPPDGSRLCIIATNVAETSVTIPNIKYVVDCGKVKTRIYDRITGVSAFHVTWTSKASANQRAGRAGRTGPGHCYRLYSSAVFNDEFAMFGEPEICRRPVDDVVLQLKEMQIDRVLNFPFPTPLDAVSVKASEVRLSMLGALETPAKEMQRKHIKKDEFYSKITALGRAMARFPVAPRFGKMIALSYQHGLLPYVICIISALTVQEVLMETNAAPPNSMEKKNVFSERRQRWLRIRRSWAGKNNSLSLGDVMVLLKAVGAAEFGGCLSNFCETNGLRYKAMAEIRKLRVQLTNAVNVTIPAANLCVDPKMVPPTDIQAKQLRQIMLAGLPDCVAKKIPEDDIKGDNRDKWRKAYSVPTFEEPVFIHHNSVLSHEQPEYLVYQEIFETSKMFMRGITAIEPEWLMVFCPDQCTFSKPLDEPPPRLDPNTGNVKCFMSATFGRSGWTLPIAELDYPPGIDRFRWFARFLLDGQVCASLQKYRCELFSSPSTMIKTWAKLQPRTETLLKALVSAGVDSKETLYKQWDQDKKYILKEYCDWVPENLHCEITEMWPPVSENTDKRLQPRSRRVYPPACVS